MAVKYSDERRAFLKGVALFSGVALRLASAKDAAAKSGPPSSQKKNGQGYRETEHIKKYYKSAGM